MNQPPLWTIESVEQLADLFRSERKKRKISMTDLAAFSDLSRDTLDDFENKRKDIRLRTLLKILSLCNLELCIRTRK